ncbi:Peroxidase [Zostera marina]|uniref:Peroxidase n=1 Tax=Zostera marina TaxID=29655 RepID=A0A0K9PFW4_ZOSMR|nr:Peroxidase [Zostera marina]
MASLFCCTIVVLTLASNINMLVNSKKAGNVVNTTCLGGGKGGDAVYGSLQFDYYFDSCPIAEEIIFSFVENAVANEPRMAASLLRLHFHDCFVNGCDGSVLLDDTHTFVGEKTAPPNLNSLRGFNVIDQIKMQLEDFCPGTVSCADIVATAARDSIVLPRTNSHPSANMAFLNSLQQVCLSGNSTLTELDYATPETFDNQYYINLLLGQGLLNSDQILVSGNSEVIRLVKTYADDIELFFEDFKNSMLRMGRLMPAQGTDGEIRRNCRFVN